MSRNTETKRRRREWDDVGPRERLRLRSEIFIAQGGVCPICDCAMIFELTNLDHIRSLARRGTNDAKNLQVVHIECNGIKASASNEIARRRIAQSNKDGETRNG